jgi:hypothetical protein
VGFRRDIRASWFDTAAALRTETDDVDEIRIRLHEILEPEIPGAENRALTVQILLRIWAKPDVESEPRFREAVACFKTLEHPGDRIWLHYGLCLLAYPFFRDAVTEVALLLRQRDAISTRLLKARIIAGLGSLGSLENATKAIMFALRQWNMLVPGEARGSYVSGPKLTTTDKSLEAWLLACALQAHPARSMAVVDLLHWPALAPFSLTLSPGDIRRFPAFDVHRQGANIDVVQPAT